MGRRTPKRWLMHATAWVGNLVLCFVQVSQVADVGRLDVDVFLVAVDGKVDVVRQGDDQVAVEIGIDTVGGQINEHTRDIEDLLGDLFQQALVFGADAVVGALNDREVRQLVWMGLKPMPLPKAMSSRWLPSRHSATLLLIFLMTFMGSPSLYGVK